MTQDQFIFSLRGTNGEGDPPRETLVEIYTSIQANEIKVSILPSPPPHAFGSEHDVILPLHLKLLENYSGGKMSQHQWLSLLKRASLVQPFSSTISGAYDKDIFSVLLNCPIIAAISVGTCQMVLSTSQYK